MAKNPNGNKKIVKFLELMVSAMLLICPPSPSTVPHIMLVIPTAADAHPNATAASKCLAWMSIVLKEASLITDGKKIKYKTNPYIASISHRTILINFVVFIFGSSWPEPKRDTPVPVTPIAAPMKQPIKPIAKPPRPDSCVQNSIEACSGL